MKVKTIDSKDEFYRLYQKGLLGNKINSWDNYEDLQKDTYNGNVSIRCRIPGSPYQRYEVPKQEVYNTCLSMIEDSGRLQLSDFKFNEPAPDQNLILQGEIVYSVPELGDHYALLWSRAKLPMRKALALGKEVSGIAAKILLQHHMNEKSWIMMEELMELYPYSAIEFSTYSHNLGIYSGYNTVIWEVRNY